MPIEEFYARSETDIVTFTKKQIQFSSSLIKAHGLSDYGYVRIGIDSELRRIYFSFQKEGGPGLLRFYQARNGRRKMFAAGKLYSKYDWLGALRSERDTAKKQFVLEKVADDENNIYPTYKFFLTIGYSWAEERSFKDQAQYPEEPGVYRLKRAGEVVRIGQGGNIRDRLQDHYKDYGNKVDTYDFEIVPDEKERQEEEKRLLNEFRGAVGRLPELNPIAH